MKVRVHPADKWGCGHYRLIWPAQVLAERGHDVEIVEPGQSSGIRATFNGDRILDIQLEDEADVFVFQRPTNQYLVEVIKRLRADDYTVVIDMDDDLSRIHPKNAAFRLLHPKWSPKNNWHHVAEACRIASLVTVSTPQLVPRYAAHGRARVLRNCVPERFLSIEPVERDELRWGWAGALHSHPDDVPLISGAAGALIREGHPFYVVGYTTGLGRALSIGDDPPGTGKVEFEDWAEALTNLDVGVAPLARTKFNEAKSWLKPLEYSALGVPWVASDRDEYRLLHEQGAGVLVGERSRDWTRALKRLMTDESYRTELGEAGRAMAARFTVEKHAWLWWDAWFEALKLDRGLSRPAQPERRPETAIRAPGRTLNWLPGPSVPNA